MLFYCDLLGKVDFCNSIPVYYSQLYGSGNGIYYFFQSFRYFFIDYLLRNNFNGLNFVLQKLSDLAIQIGSLDQNQWKVFKSGRAYSLKKVLRVFFMLKIILETILNFLFLLLCKISFWSFGPTCATDVRQACRLCCL